MATKPKLFLNQRIFIFTICKRLIDIFGSIALIIVFSPIIIPVTILIKLTSPGPIFFTTQERVGKNGKLFKIWKFRTMYIGDNDERLRAIPHLWEKYKKLDWKLPLSEDPRVTPIGKFIRTFSLDELPQVVNILKGEMSLVGPRAYRQKELEEYVNKYPNTKKYISNILSTKPGLTGPWQVSGRNDLSFEKRAQLDAHYATNRSLIQEIIILLKTPLAMFSRW